MENFSYAYIEFFLPLETFPKRNFPLSINQSFLLCVHRIFPVMGNFSYAYIEFFLPRQESFRSPLTEVSSYAYIEFFLPAIRKVSTSEQNMVKRKMYDCYSYYFLILFYLSLPIVETPLYYLVVLSRGITDTYS